MMLNNDKAGQTVVQGDCDIDDLELTGGAWMIKIIVFYTICSVSGFTIYNFFTHIGHVGHFSHDLLS